MRSRRGLRIAAHDGLPARVPEANGVILLPLRVFLEQPRRLCFFHVGLPVAAIALGLADGEVGEHEAAAAVGFLLQACDLGGRQGALIAPVLGIVDDQKIERAFGGTVQRRAFAADSPTRPPARDLMRHGVGFLSVRLRRAGGWSAWPMVRPRAAAHAARLERGRPRGREWPVLLCGCCGRAHRRWPPLPVAPGSEGGLASRSSAGSSRVRNDRCTIASGGLNWAKQSKDRGLTRAPCRQ